MVFPALCAVTVLADVTVQSDVRDATNITRTRKSLHLAGVFIIGIVAYFTSVLLSVLEIFAELFYVPLELPQQQQAPALI